ncbi:chromate transporter [Erysipelotrichaceae bacterium OH741_COT-311]|nr:chromate transporter [Erysipelotrichaceae bacterium OH741_COT-311]
MYFKLFVAFFKIGLFTFGGGYAMLPMIQKELIEKRGWASEEEILNYYAIGQCTPGVIAVNTATLIGYKFKGVLGGVIATLGVITPSLIIIMLFAVTLTNIQDVFIVKHALGGIKIAVCVLMAVSIYKLYKSAVKNYIGFMMFFASFICVYVFKVSQVAIIIATSLLTIGYLYFHKEA